MTARFVVLSQGSWATWRLVGGNNRAMARSTQEWTDTTGAVEDLERVRAGLLQFRHSTVCEVDQRLWTWELVDDSTGWTAMRSSRGYQRLRECRANLICVLEEAEGAGVVHSPLSARGIASIPTQRHADRLLVGPLDTRR